MCLYGVPTSVWPLAFTFNQAPLHHVANLYQGVNFQNQHFPRAASLDTI